MSASSIDAQRRVRAAPLSERLLVLRLDATDRPALDETADRDGCTLRLDGCALRLLAILGVLPALRLVDTALPRLGEAALPGDELRPELIAPMFELDERLEVAVLRLELAAAPLGAANLEREAEAFAAPAAVDRPDAAPLGSRRESRTAPLLEPAARGAALRAVPAAVPALRSPASRSALTMPSRVVTRAPLPVCCAPREPVAASREPVAVRLELESRRALEPLSDAAERGLRDAVAAERVLPDAAAAERESPAAVERELPAAAERELPDSIRPIVRSLLAVLCRSDDTVRRWPSPRFT